MAKELPYFKFEPNQWENGNIQICTREEKGLFIDLCSMYWSRLGDLPYKLALQKLCNGNASALQSLCDEQIIEVIEDKIFIKYLSEQLSEFEDLSEQNSKNAKKRWEKHRKQKDSIERNATALQPQSERNAIREEEIIEDKIKEEDNIKKEREDFNLFWDLYDKKVDRVKCFKVWKKLKQLEIDKILETIENYVKANQEKKYRKNPLTYLNGKCWNDEIEIVTNKKQVINEIRQQIEQEQEQRRNLQLQNRTS